MAMMTIGRWLSSMDQFCRALGLNEPIASNVQGICLRVNMEEVPTAEITLLLTEEQVKAVAGVVEEIQPQIIINDRVIKGRDLTLTKGVAN